MLKLYTCGPVPMIVIVVRQENSWGVERTRVHPIGSADEFVANSDSLMPLDFDRGRDAIAADLDFLNMLESKGIA